MATLGDLFVRLGVDLSTLNRDLTAAENRFEKFGTQLFFLGSRVTAGVTLPMIAAGAAVAKLGLDFDKAMSESLAIMQGADSKIRAELEGMALAVSETTKFSASEAAEGFRHLISAGIETSEELAGALPIAARFAQAGLMDLAKSTEYLAGAQAAMGMKTDDTTTNLQNMTRIADVLTAANNRALGTVEDYAAALSNRAGAALRQFGKSAEEGVSVLMAFHEQNIKGKTSGQQLWMVMRDLTTYALKNADAFKKYGISIFDSTGNMKNMGQIIQNITRVTEKMTAAQQAQMFIQLGIPLRSVAATRALLGMGDAIVKNEAWLRTMGGTTEEVANRQMVALWNQLLRLRHQFENVAIGIFDSFVPVIQKYVVPLAHAALDAFRGLARGIENLPEGFKLLALAGAAVVSAVGPLIAITGSLSLLLGASLRGVTLLTGGFGKMTTSLGLAMGGTTAMRMTTAQLAAAQTTAAKAAIASALAMGQNAFQANIAGAKALAFAKSQQQAAIAAGTLIVSTAQASKTFAGLGAGIGMVLSKGLDLIKWAGAAVGRFAILTAAVEILGPAIHQLFTGWGSGKDKVDSATQSTSTFGTIASATGKTLGFFSDVLNVAGGGLDMLVEAFQSGVNLAMEQFQDKTDAATRAKLALDEATADGVEGTPEIVDDMDLLNQRAETLAQKWHLLGLAWTKLVLTVENRDLPSMDEMAGDMNSFVRRMAAAANKGTGVMGRFRDPSMGGISFAEQAKWMLADDPFKQYQKLYGDQGEEFDVESKPKRPSAEERQAQELRDQLLGVNREVMALTVAWNALTPAQRSNLDIQLNLWEAYSKLRGEVGGIVPAFDLLFNKQILQQEITASLSQSTKDWTDTWSDAAKEFIDDSGRVTVAMLEMSGGGSRTNAFWKQHEGVMDELIPRYRELEPTVQMLIDRYLAWKAALPPGKEFTDAANRAREEMDKLMTDVAAKNTDLESEIHQMTESAGDSHRRTMKTKLAQITRDQSQEFKKRLQDTVYFTGAQSTVYMAQLATLLGLQKAYVTNVERSEQLRYMAVIGVNAKIIRDHKSKTNEELAEIIKRQEAWNEFFRKMEDAVSGITGIGRLASVFGDIFDSEGARSFGVAMQGVGAGVGAAVEGIQKMQGAEGWGEWIDGLASLVEGVYKAYKAISDLETRGQRVAAGAMAGWQIGNQFLPGWGGLIGMGIGAIAGAFMDDPGWAKVRKAVRQQWGVNVSEELAKAIDEDARRLGGRMNAMFAHFGDIMSEGGLDISNVGQWAQRLSTVFDELQKAMTPGRRAGGGMSIAIAVQTLDENFGTLVESGTAVSGMVNHQITELVRLERQYNLGSKAIRDFVDSQLGMMAGGFEKMVGGTFGFMNRMLDQAEDADTALEKQNGLHEKAAKLRAQIADYERNGVNNEKQATALALARVNLLRTEGQIRAEQAKQAAADAAITRLMSPEGQDAFDRMGRLAGIMFDAAVASGKDLFTVIDMMGPSLDTLAASAEAFGFTANDAFQELLGLRQFAVDNPELVASVQGLSEFMVGLSNLGFMTQEAFSDLGAEIAFTFDELVARGLSGEQAMQAMHTPLQRLWEMQRLFNYEVDDATQLLLDEAEASGAVGIQFMSAADRMVLGIDKLIGRFELFLKHLGIDIPMEAEDAANAINDAFNGVNPEVRVKITYDDPGPGYLENPTTPELGPRPTMLAEGGILDRPTFVAGERGAEVVAPLDTLFDELAAQRRSELEQEQKIIKLYLDGRPVAEAVIPHMRSVLKRHGLL